MPASSQAPALAAEDRSWSASIAAHGDGRTAMRLYLLWLATVGGVSAMVALGGFFLERNLEGQAAQDRVRRAAVKRAMINGAAEGRAIEIASAQATTVAASTSAPANSNTASADQPAASAIAPSAEAKAEPEAIPAKALDDTAPPTEPAVANDKQGGEQPVAAQSAPADLPADIVPSASAGDRALDTGNYQLAGQHFSALLKAAPGDPHALAGLARATLELGDDSRFQELRRREPQNPTVRILEVRRAMLKGDWEGAERAISQLHPSQRTRPQLTLWIAEIDSQRRRFERAKTSYSALLKSTKLKQPTLRAKTHLAMSQLQLRLRYRTAAYRHARKAAAEMDGVNCPLSTRIAEQIRRCQAALRD